MSNLLLKNFVLVVFASLFVSCSSFDGIDKNKPEGLYELAKRYEEAERYEEAIAHLNDLRNRFPYSSLALEAELKIADIQFTRESFEEAKAAYQLFKELHPKHSKIDYVTYRLGLCGYKQLPESIDRDLSSSKDALENFNLLIDVYPNSKYVKDAQSKKQEILQKLAEKELYIADFYFKRKDYLSALGRYENLLSQYPSKSLNEQALLGALRSAIAADERDRARTHYRAITSMYPKTDTAVKAKEEADKYGIR